MNKKIFFQSSLPRAGSTVLQNLLAQNPQIYATPTSGLSELVYATHSNFSDIENFKKEKDYDLCKKSFYNFCKGGIESYYSTVTTKPIIIEKNRLWVLKYPLLNKIYPNPKIIILVRDLRSIFSSFEKQYLNNPEAIYSLSSHFQDNTLQLSIYKRVEAYMKLDMVENMLTILQDILYSKNKNNIHIVKFEDLCSYPDKVLSEIYEYLEIPNFLHNFNKINQVTYENDNFHSFGNHLISPTLSPPLQDWNTILGEEISNLIYKKYDFYFKYFNYKQ
tara:strand:+ start:1013 stop:1840 length:828 start_codon:yes stop_codon:yes gene_type:complete